MKKHVPVVLDCRGVVPSRCVEVIAPSAFPARDRMKRDLQLQSARLEQLRKEADAFEAEMETRRLIARIRKESRAAVHKAKPAPRRGSTASTMTPDRTRVRRVIVERALLL